MPQNIIAANWKMNLSLQEAEDLAGEIEKYASENSVQSEVVLCTTFMQLERASEKLSQVKLGAQDVYHDENGAFTGEISVEMLQEVNTQYILTGHSERRHIIGETNELINLKNHQILHAGLNPIFCIGEKQNQREDGKLQEVIESQVEQGLTNVSEENVSKVVIAYEPVWAIGTGLNATKEDAEEAAKMTRSKIAELYSQEVADQISILYGGSVKPENIQEFASSPEINGVLVGGASLKAETFTPLIDSFEDN